MSLLRDPLPAASLIREHLPKELLRVSIDEASACWRWPRISRLSMPAIGQPAETNGRSKMNGDRMMRIAYEVIVKRKRGDFPVAVRM